jgi:hypothetical protein
MPRQCLNEGRKLNLGNKIRPAREEPVPVDLHERGPGTLPRHHPPVLRRARRRLQWLPHRRGQQTFNGRHRRQQVPLSKQ